MNTIELADVMFTSRITVKTSCYAIARAAAVETQKFFMESVVMLYRSGGLTPRLTWAKSAANHLCDPRFAMALSNSRFLGLKFNVLFDGFAEWSVTHNLSGLYEVSCRLSSSSDWEETKQQGELATVAHLPCAKPGW